MRSTAVAETTHVGTYEYRFVENGVAQFGDEESVPPQALDQLWQLSSAASGPSVRSLLWTKTTGSPDEDTQPRIVHSGRSGLVGVHLHDSLHGPGPAELTPSPLVAPARAVAGEKSQGLSKGVITHPTRGNVQYDVEYTWALAVLGESTVEYRGRSYAAWRLRRDITEVLSSPEEGRSTYVQQTEEIFAPELGLFVSIAGHRELRETRQPIKYSVDFALELQGADP